MRYLIVDLRIKFSIVIISTIGCLIVLSFFLVSGQSDREEAENFRKKTEFSEVHESSPSKEKFASFGKVDSKSSTKADSVVAFAKSLLGKPYEYGSCSPSGFDCSGFVYYVLSKFNVSVTRSSYTMAEEGVLVDSSRAQKADLIFFRGTDLKDPSVGHAGIIISEKGQPIEFIHSSSSTKNSGVVISKLHSSHYQERFVKIKRIL